jgi:hypothetical protein
MGLKPSTGLSWTRESSIYLLVNEDHLTILVVLGNAGLAEKGDARIYFGKAVDENPAEFARLVGLAKAEGLEGALKRRDEAVRAYQGLLALWTSDRDAYNRELRRFIDVHMKTASGHRTDFLQAVEAGPVAWGNRFKHRLAALPLSLADLSPAIHFPPDEPILGMCGLLRPVVKMDPADRDK